MDKLLTKFIPMLSIATSYQMNKKYLESTLEKAVQSYDNTVETLTYPALHYQKINSGILLP